MPAKFEDNLIWVAADAPVPDSSFLSSKITDLCGDLPIFWLRPAYSGGKSSRTRSTRRHQTFSRLLEFIFFAFKTKKIRVKRSS